jgi:stage II sporulation protein D
MRSAAGRKTILSVLAGLLVATGLAIVLVRGCGGCENATPHDTPLGPAPIVRVRLQNSPVRALTLRVAADTVVTINGKRVEFPAAETTLTLRRNDGAFEFAGQTHNTDRIVFTPTAAVPAFGVGENRYRGHIEAIASSARTFYLVNHVGIDDYVASVIACELYPGFADEAYCAQAITSRTLALAEIAARKSRSYDVWASVRTQRYRGADSETKKSRSATQATHGLALAIAIGDNPPAVFRPYFSACNAGYVNSLAVLTGQLDPPPIVPLRGGQQDIAQTRCRQWRWPTVRISKTEVYRALCDRYSSARKLGALRALRVLKTTSYGRPLILRATGPAPASGNPAPTFDVVAEDLLICLLRTCPKAARGLLSMNCEIRDTGSSVEFAKGGGYGHGIGMSQWGAQIRAADYGQSAKEILGFYYPTTTIIRAYK